MRLKQAISLMAAASMMGACATHNSNPAYIGNFQDWMKSSPRTVELQAKLAANPRVHVYWLESNTGRDFAKGAGEGALEGAGGALSGSGDGFLLGLLLLPVFVVGGAVIGGTQGAATSDAARHTYTIEEIREAESQFLELATSDEQLQTIETMAARTLRRIGQHRVLVADEGTAEEVPRPGHAYVMMRIDAIDFEGEGPSDKNLAMRLTMSIVADYNVTGRRRHAYSRISTTSDRYPADRWVTDEAFLRQELANAYSTLAKNAAYHMHDR